MTVATSIDITALTPAIPAAWERKISARWLELEPFALINLRGERNLLPAVRDRHRAWLVSLLRLDIEMRVVRRLMLDDVRLDESTLAVRRDLHLKLSQHPRYTERKTSAYAYIS
jgi:hypothetical protein